ncbi:MAG: stage II sporulation protein M [Deltaproteobacteria bacterium]|jgi:uncharacterized membrane protein SpoIIM required for sporulation|nr:stage II sporulation protein M [Deltaproteobacteria bacterium]
MNRPDPENSALPKAPAAPGRPEAGPPDRPRPEAAGQADRSRPEAAGPAGAFERPSGPDQAAGSSPEAAGQNLQDIPSLVLRSALFRRNRQQDWEKLEKLISRLDRRGLSSLSPQEAVELPLLYQAAASSLALARNIVLDQSLLSYLENLVLRGYLAVYGPRQKLRDLFYRFFAEEFPQAVRNLKLPLLLVTVIFAAGFIFAFLSVNQNPENFSRFVEPAMAGGRSPQSTAEELRQDELFAPWKGFEASFIAFASYLFSHNSFVAFLCFGLGFGLGLPTAVLVFSNGAGLGAMAWIHWSAGLTADFGGWILIHGVTELTAVFLASAAGLQIGLRILLPGRRGRRESLAGEGRTAAAAMTGAVFMLLVAGFIEGGFRQLVASTFLRYLIAALTLFMWIWYFAFFGRREE